LVVRLYQASIGNEPNINKRTQINKERIGITEQKEDAVKFFLWTHPTRLQYSPVHIGNLSSLVSAGFNSSWPVKLLIHGFGDSGITSWTDESLHHVAEDRKKPGSITHQRRRGRKEPQSETVFNPKAELFLRGRVFPLLRMERTRIPLLLEDSGCSRSQPRQETDRRQP